MGVVFGFIAWFFVATLLNFVLRAAIPGYSEGEGSQTFTVPMQVGRLLVGFGASLGAGVVCAAIAQSPGRPAEVLAGVMVAFFAPVHFMLWDKFPVWYHLTFLASLALAILVGARLVRRAR
jgi:hypothetical protein